MIPTNGNGVPSAFGYGLTDRSDSGNGIIVSTTHKGVLDSATQGGDGFNPIFHNHFITLKSTTGLGCPTNADAAVDKITFQSPGRVSIQTTEALQARIPNSFTGTDSFTNEPLTHLQETMCERQFRSASFLSELDQVTLHHPQFA